MQCGELAGLLIASVYIHPTLGFGFSTLGKPSSSSSSVGVDRRRRRRRSRRRRRAAASHSSV